MEASGQGFGSTLSCDGTRIRFLTEGKGLPLILCNGVLCSIGYWIHLEVPMTPHFQIDYSAFDRPEILMFLFHPRPEPRGARGGQAPFEELLIPVEKDVVVGARLYACGKQQGATILFFHGNGEIVADYDDLAPLYTERGIHFLPVDYRGYGLSTGRPTVSSMMKDCHGIFDFVRAKLRERSFSGPLIVMGRSLGSASALELAATHGDQIDGLIIESGFAFVGPLLELLGIRPETLGIREEQGFRNVDKIRTFHKPTLVIHAEYDHIIPFSDGQALFEACPARQKRFLKIPGANHNDIFLRGMHAYLGAVKDLVDLAARAEEAR